MDIVRETPIPDQGWTQRYDVLQELGDCYASVGDYENARQCYEQASWLEPDEAGPYLGTGIIELQQGRAADAEAAFRVAVRLDPCCSRAYAGLAMIAQQHAQHKQSFDFYLKSLELDSNNLTALLGLFQVSCQMGSFGNVIHYLKVYLQMHPGDASVMFCLAALYVREGQELRARDLLRDILAIGPEHEEARKLLEEIENRTCRTGKES